MFNMYPVHYTTHSFDDLIDISHAQKSQPKPLSNLVKKVFAACEHVWSYLGKVATLTRHLLNITIKTCHRLSMCCDFNTRVLSVITRLKLLSLVSVPFSIASIQTVAHKLINSFRLSDGEGVALASLSLTLIATDIVDSLTTFVNATLAIASKAPVKLFSTIGMPLAFTLIGLGTLSPSFSWSKRMRYTGTFRKRTIPKRANRRPYSEASRSSSPKNSV